MILLLSINSITAFHQQDSTGPNQNNPHSPDHILQVILEASKEQGDRMINKLEIYAPYKPLHYVWLFPTHFSALFSSYKILCVTGKFITHMTRLSKPKADRTVTTEHLRLFADQENKATLG